MLHGHRLLFWSTVMLVAIVTGCSNPTPREDVAADAGIDSMDAAIDTGSVDVPTTDLGICADMDNDGHPSAACGGDDCDDNNPRRNPSAREVCDSMGTDEDCNPCTVAEVTLNGMGGDGDRDEDGFFNQNCFNRIATGAPVPMCAAPRDNDAGADASEGGAASVERVRVSATMVTGTDCADDPAASGAGRYPGALEVCNGLDDNCDGVRDEDLEQTYLRDRDGDGFGAANAMGADVVRGCSAPMGFALSPGDCDDSRADINPGAREVCDLMANRDENCNGTAEEDCNCGSVGTTRTCCSAQGIETCTMTTGGTRWGMCTAMRSTEVCNNRDDDCNDLVDEGLRINCFPDNDNDGYAAANATTQSVCPITRPERGNCPANYTNVAPTPGNVDCNDSSPMEAPRLADVCDTIDNDCNAATTDGSMDSRVGTSCTGGAGTGRCAAGTNVCTTTGIVCRRNVPVLEMCNAQDDDCDGTLDEPTCVHATFNGAGEQVVTGYGGACLAGNQCAITACARGRANCDGSNLNGCEVATDTDSNNCGGCGIRCLEGSLCSAGICRESRAESIAVGTYFSCLRNNAGRVYCWGTNIAGQLGDGTNVSRSTPVLVAGVTDATALTAGQSHACALRANRTVACWGANGSGQLGDGTTAMRITPTPVVDLTDVVEVAAGHSHTCARRADGTVFCWGASNTATSATDPMAPVRTRPTQVPTLAGVVELTAGNGFTCARRAVGDVVCWGINASGQLGDGSNTTRGLPTVVRALPPVAALDAGDSFACARATNNTIFCWGSNATGQLGIDPRFGTMRSTPIAVAGAVDMREMSAGSAHVCARRSNGRLACWGFNGSGQLGHTSASTWVPSDVQLLKDVTDVSAGANHTCARRAFGQVVCWGNGGGGNLGNGSVLGSVAPVVVTGNAAGASVTAADRFSCTRRNTGEVLCWGENGAGQLGDGTRNSRPTMGAVANINNAIDVRAQPQFACALRSSGVVSCWGDNRAGQLGTSMPITSSMVPVDVAGVTDAVEIALGSQHACALRASGAVVCWGANRSGQLGDGTMVPRSTPVAVTGLPANIIGITAANEQTCARRAPGTDGLAPLYCWGINGSGELGNATTTNRLSPTPVASTFEWVGVATGFRFSCGRRNNGQTYCWGDGSAGQLGDGTVAARTTPTNAAVGLPDAASLSLGQAFGCALRTSGVVACWGSNSRAQLGTPPTLPSRASPANVSSTEGATSLSAGFEHACISRVGREVLCWGANDARQLGPLAVTPNSAAPVSVHEF
ncbi:MAG: hypothetical protein JNK05_37945 [Myxococcales bacterium]|nr:hypothetical protein [Myxococcales bacterium]